MKSKSALLAMVVLIARTAAAAEPADVIGKPFRISEAVTAFCSMKPPAMMCEAFKAPLGEFLAETRDAQWAAPVERLIARSIQVGGHWIAEIRALECRRTRCALEYAVWVDELGHHADGDQELDRLMENVGGVMAPELSSDGRGGMLVSVVIWRKRT